MFGGGAAAGAMGGFGMSASEWAGGPQTAAQHNTNCTSVKEYAYNEDRNQRFRPQMEDSKFLISASIPTEVCKLICVCNFFVPE